MGYDYIWIMISIHGTEFHPMQSYFKILFNMDKYRLTHDLILEKRISLCSIFYLNMYILGIWNDNRRV